jgi:hypothetical protein
MVRRPTPKGCQGHRITEGQSMTDTDQQRTGLAALMAMGGLARRIGVTMAPGSEDLEPECMMDWALHWAAQGIPIFPCERFLGTPLVPSWHRAATTDTHKIVEWWSAGPNADVAGVPDRMDTPHFAIIAAGVSGANNLAEIEGEYGPLPTTFRYLNRAGDAEHLWLQGPALTSHHRLARGLHVLGAGHYVYLPASWAPDHSINGE